MKPTGYFTHTVFRRHEMGEGHPECPQRLDAIEDRLLITGLDTALERREPTPAPLSDIELAHDRMFVASLRGLSDGLIEDMRAGGPSHANLDPDTSINAHTWEAALMAVGAAIDATDAVMAIIDFDVHHGNGTEDIVAGDDRILMCSFYQHPFYPECEHSSAPNLVNLPVPAYTRGMDVRELIDMMWMPRLDAFKPQMIFISAGFDAHREDDMGQMGLVENDYIWMTQRIKQVADRHAKGRIVSCLEGGYNLSALARSVEAHVRVLADV